jgi:hypothetical protein
LYSFCYWHELFILRALWRAVTIKTPHSEFLIPHSELVCNIFYQLSYTDGYSLFVGY